MCFAFSCFNAGVARDAEAGDTKGDDGGEGEAREGEGEGGGDGREGASLDKQVRLFIDMSTPFFKVRADGRCLCSVMLFLSKLVSTTDCRLLLQRRYRSRLPSVAPNILHSHLSL